MIINNKDITLYGATLISKSFNHSNITLSKEWLKNSVKPVVITKKSSSGSGTLKLLVEAATEEVVFEKISNLIAEISNSTINFGDPFFYKVTLDSFSEEEIFYNTFKEVYSCIITLSLAVDELYKDYVQLTLTSSMSIVSQGNKASECILEITPTQAMIDLVITGFSKKPITIKNLAINTKVIINGEDKTITANGVNKFLDSDLWEFPYLNPGTNTITFSKTYFNGIVKYKPRYV